MALANARRAADATASGPESAVRSVTQTRALPQIRLSKALWGIDWYDHFPAKVTECGIVAVPSTFDDALPFIKEHYAAIFHEDPSSPFSTTRVNPAKERYYRFAGDFFEFRDGDRTVGLMICTPADWSTYYIRSAALLREYQSRKAVRGFLELIIEVARDAGLERVEAHTSPANFPVVRLLTGLNFNVSGSELTDRWGAHVQFTRFLDREREDVFLNQFCSGVAYQRAPSREPKNQERSRS